MELTPAVRDILRAGVLAPSADNHHRLRFQPTSDGVFIWSEPGRLGQLTGYKRTLDLLSLGTVIENIVLRASAHHLSSSIELFSNNKPDLVADIKFQPTRCEPDPLHKAIPIRHTNRRFFKGLPESSDTLQKITDSAIITPECSLTWLDTPEQRGKVLRLIRLAEGERFRNPILHTEMFESIRFDVGWHQICTDGLAPATLEVERALRPLFKLMRHWPIMRLMNILGLASQLGWRAGDLPCRFAPHIGVISALSLADNDQIMAGRVFQRTWLSAAQRGLALQPMPASALYAQKTSIDQGISAKLQRQLQEGWNYLGHEKTPVVLFRMGHAEPPTVVSGRQSLDYYLII